MFRSLRRPLIITSLLLSAFPLALSKKIVQGFFALPVSESLPKPLSDFTAVTNGNKVYLSGGCDSENGNEFDETEGEFICKSISDVQYVFDLELESFDETEPLPTPRYRHAAVFSKNKVWLVGGRDDAGFVIRNVDVYDVVTDTWETYTDLDESLVVSDMTGFPGPNGEVFIAGGYLQNYTAVDYVLQMQIDSSSSLNATMVAPLIVPRGDVSAATSVDEDGKPFALVSGGFTDDNGFCEPLNAVEKFDFTGWFNVSALPTSRGDKALVELNGKIYGIGGERSIANICEDNEVEPGEQSVPIEDVEWYDVEKDTWTKIDDLPDHRFRFAAVGYEDKIYSFGGQVGFDKQCNCFKTSDEVVKYGELTIEAEETEAPTSSPTSGAGQTKLLICFGVSAMLLLSHLLCSP